MKSSPSDTPSWNGTNSSGFSAVPLGKRYCGDGATSSPSDQAVFWMRDDSGTNASIAVLQAAVDNASGSSVDKGTGYAGRCLLDSE
jgi:uncharacterized protein (TIGR02145 family)